MSVYTDEFWNAEADKLTNTNQILKLPWEEKKEKLQQFSDEKWGIHFKNEHKAYEFMIKKSDNKTRELSGYLLQDYSFELLPWFWNKEGYAEGNFSYTASPSKKRKFDLLLPNNSRNFMLLAYRDDTPQNQRTDIFAQPRAYVHTHLYNPELSEEDFNICINFNIPIFAIAASRYQNFITYATPEMAKNYDNIIIPKGKYLIKNVHSIMDLIS